MITRRLKDEPRGHGRPDVSVITAALPNRFHLLRETLDSVRAQTLQPAAHIVNVDYERRGAAHTRNAAAAGVTSEWLCFVDDDDVLYPTHLERMVQAARSDVIYCYADMRDWPDHSLNKFAINRPFDPFMLKNVNYIPGGCSLIRRAIFEKVDGFPDEHDEDWGLWKRILDIGGTFQCLPETLWFYRRHEIQKQAETLGHGR